MVIVRLLTYFRRRSVSFYEGQAGYLLLEMLSGIELDCLRYIILFMSHVPCSMFCVQIAGLLAAELVPEDS